MWWSSYDISTVSMPLYPSLPMLRLTVIPPNFGPGSFSTMKQHTPASVRAARATMSARSPFVTHILVPSITYSSPSRTALHARLRVSLPASDSESERQPRISPDASRGSQFCFCASVPWCTIRYAAMVCVLTMPDNDIQPYASSSTTPMYVSRSRPSPPYSSGIVMPNSPSVFICPTMAVGNSSACSRSEATGMASRAMKRRTVSTISWRISGSVVTVMRRTLQVPRRDAPKDRAGHGGRYRTNPDDEPHDDPGFSSRRSPARPEAQPADDAPGAHVVRAVQASAHRFRDRGRPRRDRGRDPAAPREAADRHRPARQEPAHGGRDRAGGRGARLRRRDALARAALPLVAGR